MFTRLELHACNKRKKMKSLSNNVLKSAVTTAAVVSCITAALGITVYSAIVSHYPGLYEIKIDGPIVMHLTVDGRHPKTDPE